MSASESCVETPAAPEWLSKLESRREKLSRAKLGHESGAGAPCNECGSKCPGLDLHFWRKVCRNCKCRKDQHMCIEDDTSGWAQFEILGQIRSKPAYIKIKALADNPVKVEWVPPNAAHDLVSDYMDKLGSDQIPIEGSEAAKKRKQQLEFQVPPHDLDAELCDNLTESETSQLQEYVKKVRESCVGQGNVVRIGTTLHGVVSTVGEPVQDGLNSVAVFHPPAEVFKKLKATPSQILNDKFFMNLLKSENLSNAILCEPSFPLTKKLVAFLRPLTPDFDGKLGLPEKSKNKLTNMNVNTEMIRSAVENGPAYDNMLDQLKKSKFDISQDPVLNPIDNFRKSYLYDLDFQKDIDQFMDFLDKILPTYSTPTKSHISGSPDKFNSPLSLRNPVPARTGSLMYQETPMRKVKFGGVNVAYDLDLPIDSSAERDTVLSKIINSEALAGALQNPAKMMAGNNVTITRSPMTPDFVAADGLSSPVRDMLESIRVNKNAVQSGVVNGPIYDKLFENLGKYGINYADCKLLQPMDLFRQEYTGNIPFQQEVKAFVEKLPNNYHISCSVNQPGMYYQPNHISPEHSLPKGKQGFLSNPQSPFRTNMHGSPSADSGFDSKPPTPNYSSFPGLSEGNAPQNFYEVGASPGKLKSIPGIEDLNMYPQIHPSPAKILPRAAETANKAMADMQISDPIATNQRPIPVTNCKECKKNLMTGEVAVKAERAGRDVAWHPQCFVCHKCRELLADLVYFFHGGNVYCGRDLADILKIPRCSACDELIFTKEYTAAENATFHIKHFCCYQCDIPLAGQHYVPDEKTNMPLCLKCCELGAERCQLCKLPIGPTEQGVRWQDIHWHSGCFICGGVDCGKSLINGRFCVKNKIPFCSRDCIQSVIS